MKPIATTVLTFVVIAGLSLPLFKAKADITSGLVGYWTFDEGTGSVAGDSGSGNHDGTINDSPLWVAGKVGSGALDFSLGGTVSLGVIQDTYPLSECAWIKTSSEGTSGYIISSLHFSIPYTGNGADQIGAYNNMGIVVSDSNVIDVGTWHHVCITADDTGNATIYIDGDANASGNIGVQTATSAFTVAATSFPGIIDDVRIYSRELSSLDVSELYDTTSGAAPDTTAPVVSSVASSTTATTASVTWDTDEAADSQVFYGLDTSYGNSTTLDTATTTSHDVPITGLSPSTLYHFKVVSADDSSNVGSSTDHTFLTQASDVDPPVISNISASGITTSAATIAWTTDEVADSQVYYGLTSSYGSSSNLDSSLVTSHSVGLTNLQAGTTYHYLVVSRDSSDNTASSTDQTFDTTGSDVTAPIVSLGSPSGILAAGTTDVTISVATDEAATCKYGTNAGTAYGSIASTFLTTGGTTHSQSITGLSSGSHSYYVRCIDGSSNSNASDFTISFTIDQASSGSGGSRARSSSGGSTGGRFAVTTNSPVSANGTNLVSSYSQPSLSQFIELLIAIGAISPDKAASARALYPTTSVAAPPSLTFTRNLAISYSGADVRSLQQYLNSKGFMVAHTGVGSPGNETDQFGKATQAALKAYQTAVGLPATGLFGPLTREAVLRGAP
ncbi:MAG TPA: fibronectin type III domain-containing protein [Candidatus Paceibacterota bacterium]|jgi:Putative peptidoglycan-binding domain-containing protein